MSPNITQFGFISKRSALGRITSRSKRMGGFVLDVSEVTRNMALLNTVVLPAKVRMGLGMAGKKLMMDCITSYPAVPIKRPDYKDAMRKAGELRASGAVFVDLKKVGTTKDYGESASGRYQPDSYGGTPLIPLVPQACVVFNAPYAAKQHQSFPTKSDKPMSGMNYLGAKLYGNAVEYIAIIVKAIKL